MLDVSIEAYIHAIHFPDTWPLIKRFHDEVNGESDRFMSVEIDSDSNKVSWKLENWAQEWLKNAKVARDLTTGNILGFIGYCIKNDALSINSLYIIPEMRYNGVSKAFLYSFPGIKKGSFTLHKNRRESPLIGGLLHSRKISDDPANPEKFEIWEFDIVASVNNQYMKKVREENNNNAI